MNVKDLYASGLAKAPQAVMLTIFRPARSGMAVTDIAKALGASMSATSAAVTKLERDGVVQRHYPSRDGRKVTAYLTDAGYESAAAMWAAVQNVAAAAHTTEM